METPRGPRPPAGRRPAPRTARPPDAQAPRDRDELAAHRRGQRRPAPAKVRPPDPLIPADVAAEQLDPQVRAELGSLPSSLAERVARHLVAAGSLLDDEPARAAEHARFARSLAPRVAATREAAGIAGYLAGDFADALADLRALRRMTGRPDHLPVMADCERGLGRPQRAVTLAHDPDVARLDRAAQVELRIVESGARRDLGEYEAALVVLQGPELATESVQPWTARLWYAYADALLAAGRREEARSWFAATVAIDEEEETDAAERVSSLGDEPA